MGANNINNLWDSIQRTNHLKNKGYDTITCNEDSILYFDHTEQEVMGWKLKAARATLKLKN